MLIFWLTLPFASFGLFVRANVTVVVRPICLGSDGLWGNLSILEMRQPCSGFIRASETPLRAALAQLGH